MATIMDGKALSQKLKEQMKERIAQMRAEGIIPKLVVVLVGNDSASYSLIFKRFINRKSTYI